MDRSYRAKESIKVFKTIEGKELVETIQRVPYSRYGFDLYKYKDEMYYGYIDKKTRQPFIALDKPYMYQ